MATVVGLTLIKKFTYRLDATEEWSNKYYFTGSVPADSTAWKALTDALATQEKTCYTNASQTVRAYGYNSDDLHASAVWSWDYIAQGGAQAGTAISTGGNLMAGDQAAMLEWKTSRLSSKGKPIYLRKYFHCLNSATGNPDSLLTANKTALETFGTKMMDGTFLDARTLRSRLNTETLTARIASPWVTTRTLKRRGRRPT